jgi:hypothetical protein
MPIINYSLRRTMSKSCRYYEQKFPEVDEVVMVNVRSIAEMGAYVSLLEYDGIEGMVCLYKKKVCSLLYLHMCLCLCMKTC